MSAAQGLGWARVSLLHRFAWGCVELAWVGLHGAVWGCCRRDPAFIIISFPCFLKPSLQPLLLPLGPTCVYGYVASFYDEKHKRWFKMDWETVEEVAHHDFFGVMLYLS